MPTPTSSNPEKPFLDATLRWILAIIAIPVLVILLLYLDKRRMRARVEAELAAIRAQGLPADCNDLDRWYKHPEGANAAAIYLAGKLTNDKQTQKGIAGRLAGVTEVTIRNRYEEIARELNIEPKPARKEASSPKRKERQEQEK